MESSLSDFGFAFNDATFSDRILRIEITGSREVTCTSVVDLVRNRKRRREEAETSTNAVLDLGSYHVESTNLDKNLCETNGENSKKHEEAQAGGDYDSESYWKLTSPLVLRVKEIHISSLLLAAKSPFFYKLFSNGMRESEQKHVTLSIDASEEIAVMELLNFMYTNTLSVTTAPALLDVLMVADKFEVPLCMNYCSSLLLNMTMTVDIALLLLELPPSIQAADSVKPLTNAARQFIASSFKNMSKVPTKEFMALPLVGIEAIIASDELEVASEDVVYDNILVWAKTNYSVVEERQEILGSNLARYIRFPRMSCYRLKKILDSDDFTEPVQTALVLEALFSKAASKDNQRSIAAKLDSPGHRYAQRAYKYKPIKMVQFEIPRQECVVYLDLSYKDCAELYPSGRLFSEGFRFGGQAFFFSANCSTTPQNVFVLSMMIEESGPGNLTLEYEFSARLKPTEDFVPKYKGIYQITGSNNVGYLKLFVVPWESFMSRTCPFFINDVLHVRAEFSIRR
ncbi:hypothetical protein AALP_AA6G016900 [Arabis alpina]|uniref:BTB domain-containing protein n=1 Tax=Arabis alpina TaxID=50452 RepID=A0A087GLF2_ARAAL|nr:hypothetical protein AALP_AA6G016900 [Arabis alpina]